MALTKIPASLLDTSGGLDLQGNITLGDSEKILLGDSSDLQIYHDESGGHSRIDDTGTGGLVIRGSQVLLEKYGGGYMINAVADGASELYHSGSKKFETTSTGATVTGNLAVTGDLDITGNVNSASVTDLDVTDKTITLGAGQTEALSGGSGIIIDGSGASILWDETNTEWDFNSIINAPSVFSQYYSIRESGTQYGFIGQYKTLAGTGTDTSLTIFSETGDGINFAVNGSVTKAVVIDAEGDVGIGDTAPSFKLDVNTTGSRARFKANTGDANVELSSIAGRDYILQSLSSGTFRIYDDDANAARLTIDSTGNVGINETSPNAYFHVTGKASYTTATSSEVSGLGFVRLQPNSSSEHSLWIHNAGNNLGISGYTDASTTTSRDITLQTYGGNVGIGETSPDKQLHIKNTATGDTGIVIENTNNAQNLDIDFYNNVGSAQGRIRYAEGAGSFEINPNVSGSVPFTILYGGNVGIGDTNPGEKLTVAGNIDIGSNGVKASMIGRSATNSADANINFWDYNHATFPGHVHIVADSAGSDGTYGAGQIVFWTHNGSAFNVNGLIDKNGKFIIGDTASHVDDLLQIETPASGGGHGIQIRRNDSNGDQGIGRVMFGNNNDTDLATIQAITDGQADCARLVFSTQPTSGSSTERMAIMSNGETRRNYSSNTDNSKKWWSTTSNNFGEVYEYDYGTNLYFKKTRSVQGYSQMLLHGRYMPNQYDVSFELKSNITPGVYRHFGIALNHVGTENSSTFDYLVLRQHPTSSTNNQVRLDLTTGTVGDVSGSSVPNFHDGTKRKIMIQKRANTLRMQVHELNGTVFTYGTITGITWTNSSGYFGFNIYESPDSYSFAEVSNLTFYDVIA